ncbi:MAG: putative RNA methyltransferase [Eubacteriales bacterium]|jgi:23S rRNA (guanine745-N1)-methyltransferase
MSYLVCPCCGQPLEKQDRRFVCPHGHSFDMAKEGYVNLLLPNHKRSHDPGDSREMCQARSRFFARDPYRVLREGLQEAVARQLGELPSPAIADVGCGQGYYTISLWKHLTAQGQVPAMLGTDISKFALRQAAKACPDITWAVASLFALPVADASLDCVVDSFAPLAWEEFHRVLRPSGLLALAIPGPRHLWGLKEVLYPEPYPNPPKEFHPPGFESVAQLTFTDLLTVEGQESIQSLFHMTPYAFRTPEAGQKALANLKTLTTPVDFQLHLLRRGC